MSTKTKNSGRVDAKPAKKATKAAAKKIPVKKTAVKTTTVKPSPHVPKDDGAPIPSYLLRWRKANLKLMSTKTKNSGRVDAKPAKKATKTAVKKIPVKKTAVKKTAVKPSPRVPKDDGAPATSYLLRLEEGKPETIALMAMLHDTWGFTYVPDADGEARFFRKTLFSLRGSDGKRWRQMLFPERQPTLGHEDDNAENFGKLQTMRYTVDTWSAFEWFALWVHGDTEGLERIVQVEDDIEGDAAFFLWVELLMMADEVADFFRGTNSDIWGSMKSAHLTDSAGFGLQFLAYLQRLGMEGQVRRAKSPLPAFTPREGFQAEEETLLHLRDWAPTVFAKVLEVLQSPAMDSRFKALFQTIAQRLNLTHQELYDSLYYLMPPGDFRHEGAPSLLQAKVGQALGVLGTSDEVPDSLTEVLEDWVHHLLEVPETGWPVGADYEAKAKAQRLKLIAARQRGKSGGKRTGVKPRKSAL